MSIDLNGPVICSDEINFAENGQSTSFSTQSNCFDKYGFSLNNESPTNDQQATTHDVSALLRREMKWHSMLTKWDWNLASLKKEGRVSKYISRCRKGIPDSMRAEAWQKMCLSPATSLCKPKVIISASSDKRQNRFKFITLKPPERLGSTVSLHIDNRNISKKYPFRLPILRKSSHQTIHENTYIPSIVASANASIVGKALSGKKRPTNIEPIESKLSDPNLNSSSASSGYQSKDMPILPRTIQLALSPPDQYYTAFDTPQTGSINSCNKLNNENSLPSSLYCDSIHSSTCEISKKGTRKNFIFETDNLNIENISITSSNKKDHHGSSTISSASDLSHFGRVSTLVPDTSFVNIQNEPLRDYLYYKSQTIEDVYEDQIDRDLHRQFPHHELFSEKHFGGQETLRGILRAYVAKHPEEGYCQGQAPLAAVFLMYMPEMNAFWVLDRICQVHLRNYFGPSMHTIQIDEWFMCVYIRSLPWSCVLRVLDMFIAEGKIVLYRVGLVLILRCFNDVQDRNNCPDFEDVHDRLTNFSKSIKDTEKFVKEIIDCPINHDIIGKETLKQSKKFESSNSQNI